jgi:hypothetical protein
MESSLKKMLNFYLPSRLVVQPMDQTIAHWKIWSITRSKCSSYSLVIFLISVYLKFYKKQFSILIKDCTKFPSLLVTIYLQLILTNYTHGYKSSTNRFFRVVINLFLFFSCSGNTLSQLSIRGRTPIEAGYI